ncbi:hypothetical protein DPV78_000277 [Talaromyces pinophilus]|nr:hypothetical protein DPV78_000277 [Talaromyces pinophilus]
MNPNKELGYELLYMNGKCGVLFKITLWLYEYIFIGKGVLIDFIKCAKWEEMAETALCAIHYLDILYSDLILGNMI